MKRIILSVLILPFALTNLLAQANDRRSLSTTCTLNKTQSQDVRGFHLGTKWEQVVARFSGSLEESTRARQIDIFPNGLLNVVSESGRRYASRFKPSELHNLNEVTRILLGFFDGEIVLIKVTYDGTTHWRTLDEFAMKISEGLSLPNTWRRDKYNAERVLECTNFKVTASLVSTCDNPPFCGPPEKIIYLPTLAFEDTTVLERNGARMRKQRAEQERREEEKRRVFKP